MTTPPWWRENAIRRIIIIIFTRASFLSVPLLITRKSHNYNPITCNSLAPTDAQSHFAFEGQLIENLPIVSTDNIIIKVLVTRLNFNKLILIYRIYLIFISIYNKHFLSHLFTLESEVVNTKKLDLLYVSGNSNC